MLGMLSDTGVLILVIAVVLLFGTSQIPKLARNLAEAGKEFRQAHADAESESPPPSAAALPAVATAPAEERVTLTRSELDALIAASQAQVSDRS
jgi:sec-independent protein translocase protein TatA